MEKAFFELINKHIRISWETFEKLKLYNELLIKWQNKINLISNDTIENAWERHFLDSLQLISYIDEQNKTIVDLGSGAGFPALVLAVVGYENIHLVESDARKCVFLREVARVTKAKATIHNCRIEDMEIPSINIITSRACASLDKLFHLISKKISRETICLFHKGKNYNIECEEANKTWQYDISVMPSIIDFDSVILKISDLKKR